MKKYSLIVLMSPLITLATQFIAFGDSGKDNEGQKQVAQLMLQHCSKTKCDYGLLLGDNAYEDGMASVDDPIMDRVFKKHYEPLQIPFFVALGNHDYGKWSNNWTKGAYELEYAKRNPQFILPKNFYYKEFDRFVLVVLDTTRLMWSQDIDAQAQMVQEAYEKSIGKWLIVAAHHPYLSNGNHGNAGNYERIPFPAFVSGSEVKKFIEHNICGRAQVYLSGHDHNMQIIDGRIKDCDTLFVVSGAGASVEPLVESRNPVLFQAEKLGFLSMNINQKILDLEFIGADNQSLYKTRISLR